MAGMLSDKQLANVRKAAQRLWEPVPQPRRAKPRPAKTWAGLSLGRVLKAKQPTAGQPKDSQWIVTEVTNQGVKLELGGTVVWTSNRAWRDQFELVRRVRGRK